MTESPHVNFSLRVVTEVHALPSDSLVTSQPLVRDCAVLLCQFKLAMLVEAHDKLVRAQQAIAIIACFSFLVVKIPLDVELRASLSELLDTAANQPLPTSLPDPRFSFQLFRILLNRWQFRKRPMTDDQQADNSRDDNDYAPPTAQEFARSCNLSPVVC